jgi:hypothetical protein
MIIDAIAVLGLFIFYTCLFGFIVCVFRIRVLCITTQVLVSTLSAAITFQFIYCFVLYAI